MSQEEDLTSIDLRLSRLEMQLLGVQLSELKTATKSEHRGSPVKSMPSLTAGEDDDDLAVLDTESSPSSKSTDFASRLTTLEQSVFNAFSKSSQQRSTIDQLETHWKEINAYLRDLDPGTALTHQQQIAAPLLYRRQEVLASADELKQSMRQVAEILHLLMIGQNLPENNNKISEMHVTKAPILMTTSGLSREEQDTLNQVGSTLMDLNTRIDASAMKLDQMLTGYQLLVTSVSEKLVFMDEEIRSKKQ